jgi:hypothetical protein
MQLLIRRAVVILWVVVLVHCLVPATAVNEDVELEDAIHYFEKENAEGGSFRVSADDASSIESWVIAIRRELHRVPELLYDLPATSKIVLDTLDELKIPYQYPIAQHGIVATLGTSDYPCIALRAGTAPYVTLHRHFCFHCTSLLNELCCCCLRKDMDALPIHEEVEVEFKSGTDGQMHGSDSVDWSCPPLNLKN